MSVLLLAILYLMIADRKKVGRPRKQKMLIESDEEEGEPSSQQTYTSLEAAGVTEEPIEYEGAVPFAQQVSVCKLQSCL